MPKLIGQVPISTTSTEAAVIQEHKLYALIPFLCAGPRLLWKKPEARVAAPAQLVPWHGHGTCSGATFVQIPCSGSLYGLPIGLRIEPRTRLLLRAAYKQLYAEPP